MTSSQQETEPTQTPAEPTPAPSPDIHSVREEAANYRHRAHDAEARAEAAEKQLQAIRGVRLKQQITNAHPATGATDAIIEALGDTTDIYDGNGGIDTEALDKRLTDLAESRPYLFDGHHDADVESAWKDVHERFPKIDEAAREFCSETEPDAIRAWGEKFGAWLESISRHVPNDTERRLMQHIGTNAASPSAPARGSGGDSLRSAIMGKRG